MRKKKKPTRGERIEHEMLLGRTKVRELQWHADKRSKSKVRPRIIRALGQQTHVFVAKTKARGDFDSSGPEYKYKYYSCMTKKKPI